MSSHKNFCALTVSMIVGAGCCVPTYAQHKMSLQSLFDRMANSPHHIGATALQLRPVRSSMQVEPSAQALKWQSWGAGWQSLM